MAKLFSAIGKVEVEHEKMYQKLLDKLCSDHEFESDEEEAWICNYVYYDVTGYK